MASSTFLSLAGILLCSYWHFAIAADCPPERALTPAPSGCRYQEIINQDGCRIVIPIPICNDTMGQTSGQQLRGACSASSCRPNEVCENGVCVSQDRCKTLQCSNGCRNGQCIDAAYTQTTSRVRSTVCSTIACGPCERCVVNGVGAPKCIYTEGCCPATARLNACFVDPCLSFQHSCPGAAYCVSVTCDGCSTRLYDREFNLLSPASCTSSSSPQLKSSSMKLPEYNPMYSTVKPGSCPKSLSWIITACVQECWSDNDCAGMSKCCTDGCARRCSQPITDGRNYLSFPIYTRASNGYASVGRFQKN